MPAPRSVGAAAKGCPLWVISGHFALHSPCPLYTQERTFAVHQPMSACRPGQCRAERRSDARWCRCSDARRSLDQKRAASYCGPSLVWV